MEITPPVSPTVDTGTDSNDFLQTRGTWGFHCVGDAAGKKSFDIHGFVLNGEGNLNDSTDLDMKVKQPFITVFKHLHDIDNSCPDDLDRLFKIARNRMCLLESSHKSSIGTHGIFSNDHLSGPITDLGQVRLELREFFIMLRIFLNLHYSHQDSLWILHESLPIILKGLKVLRTQMGWLTDLPSPVLSFGHIKGDSKTAAPAAFHVFHSHLEMRWLYISVLWTLSLSIDTHSSLGTPQIAEIVQKFTAESSIYGVLQSVVQLCVVDLIEMAVTKFNKLDQEMLAQSSIFNCMCVKELWLLMRLVTERALHNEFKSFWKLLDGLLELLVKDNNPNSSKMGYKPLQMPSLISCANPPFFCLWFVQNIGELYTYPGANGVPTEIEGGQPVLKRILSEATSLPNMDESQRRVLVGLVTCVMKEPWKPKAEHIMMLWDLFCRNLDSAFQLPGAPTSSFAIPKETVKDILSSVNYYKTEVNSRKITNSFDMFLRLLDNFLKEEPSQWKSKMSGRFCSKLSGKKVNGLNEMGLFHLTQLFLTVAMNTDLEDVACLFQKLVSFSESSLERNAMIIKCQLCFVYLVAETNKPLAPYICHITKIIDSLSTNCQGSVAQVFVENLSFIIISNDSLPPDLHVICGDWIKKFLRQQSHKESVRSLLKVMVEILNKVLEDSNDFVGGGVERLVIALHQNLLPYVKEHRRSAWEEVADLACYFTITALEFKSSLAGQDSYESLLHHFLLSDVANIIFIRRYIYQILQSSKIRDVTDMNESQQVIFIQAWLRCSTVDLYKDVNVTKKITSMPFLRKLVSVHSCGVEDYIAHTPDPLVSLIEDLGNAPTVDKKSFGTLIEPMKLFVPVVKSSLFPVKTKDTSWKVDKSPELSKDAIVRSFYVFGVLTQKCSHLIFEKNSSSFLIMLLNTLVIPPVVLDMDNRLPLPMDEGLRKSIYLYLQGLHKLDPEKEPSLKRIFSTIVEVYVPRFGVSPQTDPFCKIWNEPEHMSLDIYIVQVVCDTLLNCKTNSPHKHLALGLRFVNELIKRNDSDEVLHGVLIANVFPRCLLIVAKAESDLSFSSKRQEITRTLHLIFEAEIYLTTPNLWSLTDKALSDLSEKYLSFRSEIFLRMLLFLTKDFKTILKRFFPIFEVNVKKVIAKRGSGSDKTLESFLSKLKSIFNS